MVISGQTIVSPSFVKWSVMEVQYLIHSVNWWKQSRWYRTCPLLRVYLNQVLTAVSWMGWCHASLLKWGCSLWSTEKAKWSIYTTICGESEAARGRGNGAKRYWLSGSTQTGARANTLHHCHFRSSWETFLFRCLCSHLLSSHLLESVLTFPLDCLLLSCFLSHTFSLHLSSNGERGGGAELPFTPILAETRGWRSPY